MSLTPEITGRLGIRSSAATFVAALEQRIAAGLLTGKPHARSNYRIVSSAPDQLRFEAASYWTAINVGLNDVELRLLGSGAVQYRVLYWQWTWFCVGLCGLLGLIGITLLLTTDARAYLEQTALGMVPGLSADHNVAIAWGMAIFWGFAWPWIMVALHKRPLRQLVARLVGEVDARADGQ